MSLPTVPETPAIERVLSESWGVPVAIAYAEHLAPWSVLRCGLAGSPGGLPESVIVKWLRKDSNEFRTDPRQVRTERAALEFLAELGLALAPRLLASDLSANLLVLEDLSPRIPLSDLLRRDGAESSAAGLFAFARALGELGAATFGLAGRYASIRTRFGEPERRTTGTDVLGCQWIQIRPLLEEFGLAINGSADQELLHVIRILTHPGVFDVLGNGDPEANNFMVDGDDGRLIDFEFAEYCHAAVNVTWIHVPGPAWMTVKNPLAGDLEGEFRRALSRTVPAAEDDEMFGSGMAAACIAKALARLNRFPVLDGREPGDDSRIQMVSTLESAADATERHRVFPDLRGWIRNVAAFLRTRWKDADVDLSTYRDHTQRR